MADDGYLIGYEDSNNNFVEVGRFNNTAEDVTQPIIIQHSDSGEKIELGPDGFSTNSISVSDIGVDTTLNFNRVQETISSGEISYSAPYIRVGGEGGSADDLDTISGHNTGDIVVLESNGDDISVTENDNIRLANAPRVLSSADDTLTLISVNGVNWNEISYSDNA